MVFYEWKTAFQQTASMVSGFKLGLYGYYNNVISQLLHMPGQEDERMRFAAERLWYKKSRPYYKLWPSIIPALMKVPLSIPGSSITLPDGIICLRFPPCPECQQGQWEPCGILSCISSESSPSACRTLISVVQHSSPDDCRDAYSQTVICKLVDTVSIEDHLDTTRSIGKNNLTVEEHADIRMALRMTLAISLLANDPTIIEPDVLNRDDARYQRTQDNRLVKKAIRRGKHGFHIGRLLESMPHYRRPHFGIRYTGKGSAVPKIVPIKGAVVHRKKITTVPTGHLTTDGTEQE